MVDHSMTERLAGIPIRPNITNDMLLNILLNSVQFSIRIFDVTHKSIINCTPVKL